MLYVIEYYDIDLDKTDYATATGRKILVDINRVNGVEDPYYRKCGLK